MSRRKRLAAREAAAAAERETEIYVRSRMKPGLVASAKKAASSFKSESFGLFTQETNHEGPKEVR